MASLLASLALLGALSASAQQIPLPALPKTLLGLDTGKAPLYFDRAGKFKVLSFSDMHFGEGSFNDTNDQKTQGVHATVLDQEKPNFVVFNGDLITGERQTPSSNISALLDLCFAPTVKRKLPFSCTYGNHDNAINLNHSIEFALEKAHYGGKKGLSYSRSDVGAAPYDVSNYWLPVYASKPRSQRRWLSRPSKSHYTTPALIMWFLDSRAYVGGNGTADPGNPVVPYWVDENVVPRYVRSQAALMRKTWGSLPPSLVFVHIPFKLAKDLVPLPTLGNHYDSRVRNKMVTQGYLNDDDTTYLGTDWPAYAELLLLDEGVGKVLAVTSGHDHGESWCGRSVNSSAVTMCYDGHSGYGGYAYGPDAQVRNGRVFTLNLKDLARKSPSAQTYLSYENGTRNDAVQLNQQYLAPYN